MNKAMNKLQKATAGVLSLTALAAGLAVGGLTTPVQAASLDDITVTLSSSAVNTSTTATVAFTPATAFIANTGVTIAYTGFTGTPTVTSTGTTCTTSSATAGNINLVCGVSTAGVSFELAGLTTPTTAGNYGFTVITDNGGTGSTIDSGAGLAYVANENEVLVTAAVAPVIDLELYQTGSTSLLTNSSTGPNVCNLGVLTVATINTCAYDLGFGTNNTAGATVQVIADGALNNATDSIADATTITAGTEGYGFAITNETTACGTITTTYDSTSVVPTTAATLLSNDAICDGAASASTTHRSQITHSAAISASTTVGNYDQLVTYTAFTN